MKPILYHCIVILQILVFFHSHYNLNYCPFFSRYYYYSSTGKAVDPNETNNFINRNYTEHCVKHSKPIIRRLEKCYGRRETGHYLVVTIS